MFSGSPDLLLPICELCGRRVLWYGTVAPTPDQQQVLLQARRCRLCSCLDRIGDAFRVLRPDSSFTLRAIEALEGLVLLLILVARYVDERHEDFRRVRQRSV